MTTGHVAGFDVWDDQLAGVWRWRAFGPDGTREGTGTSPENCQSQAQRAKDELTGWRHAPRPKETQR